MFDPKTFQSKAASNIASKYAAYIRSDDRPFATKHRPRPFFQGLSSITGSGKTAMLAQTLVDIRIHEACLQEPEPIILWMSKARAVVAQTFRDFSAGGKYHLLLENFRTVLPRQLTVDLIDDDSQPLIVTLTTGTFNQDSRDEGSLNWHQVSEDRFGGVSPWDALKARSGTSCRRPLFVVYDEAHNLSPQQTELLEELEPDAYLVASATLQWPPKFYEEVIRPYKNWCDKNGMSTENPLVTVVETKDVLLAELIKKHIDFDGSTAGMESCIHALLDQYKILCSEALQFGISPKAIYVSDTNLVRGEDKDAPDTPFSLRKSPMARIWTCLVEAGVDPSEIAIYSSELEVAAKPAGLNLFGKKEDDFSKFTEGNFRHIIFNQSLQEGWDDPECYLAYIDKSMESRVQIEQVIGRVLRQPGAKHLNVGCLDTAHFVVRVDRHETFANVVESVQKKLFGAPQDFFRSNFTPRDIEPPIRVSPRFSPTIGSINLNLAEVETQIETLLQTLSRFNPDDGASMGLAEGAKQRLDVEAQALTSKTEWKKGAVGTRQVKLRWLVSTRMREQSHRILNVVKTKDSMFDMPVQIGSIVDNQVGAIAKTAFDIYRNHARLSYKTSDQYIFEDISVKASQASKFTKSVYEQYSDLNEFELTLARSLDSFHHLAEGEEILWHRNGVRGGGFAIPLIDESETSNFYPDFLVWRAGVIFALDTKGEHLLRDAARRKLFDIREGNITKVMTRFITRGRRDKLTDRPAKEGYTVVAFRDSSEICIPCDSIGEAVSHSLVI